MSDLRDNQGMQHPDVCQRVESPSSSDQISRPATRLVGDKPHNRYPSFLREASLLRGNSRSQQALHDAFYQSHGSRYIRSPDAHRTSRSR